MAKNHEKRFLKIQNLLAGNPVNSEISTSSQKGSTSSITTLLLFVQKITLMRHSTGCLIFSRILLKAATGCPKPTRKLPTSTGEGGSCR